MSSGDVVLKKRKLKKVLIANRGEIAVRIIRACRELGIKSLIVYSTADRDSLAVQMADEAVCIGPPQPRESYLKATSIVAAARAWGADAVHPGYGFLAENAAFAHLCAEQELIFIGPPPSAMAMMGDKAVARETVRRAGVPVVPGSDGPIHSAEEALSWAEKIGYPVLVKAAAGGGGRGMRVAGDAGELVKAVQTAQAEAQAAFGDATIYLEKYITRPRHIEIQVLGDKYGHIIHLGERECSIQRRNQKMIEEAPSPAVNTELRLKMGASAVNAARSVGYYSAGTVEFILDENGNYYFIEMNTRIQVEHPVTEMITGIDLVKWQILIAAGEQLPWRQEDICWRGWALECRITAEDPEHNFRPVPGLITVYRPPGGPGVRVDSAVFSGWRVPPYYDSLLAKLITWGSDRAEAIARMERALGEIVIKGVPTTIAFHQAVMRHPLFRSGTYNTGFIAEHFQK